LQNTKKQNKKQRLSNFLLLVVLPEVVQLCSVEYFLVYLVKVKLDFNDTRRTRTGSRTKKKLDWTVMHN
jgi:hypothetical protein